MMLVCKTAGHHGNHRPGDHGLVVGEPFVVADGTAVLDIQATVRSTTDLRGQNLEGVGQASADNVDPHARLAVAQATSLPA